MDTREGVLPGFAISLLLFVCTWDSLPFANTHSNGVRDVRRMHNVHENTATIISQHLSGTVVVLPLLIDSMCHLSYIQCAVSDSYANASYDLC